MESYVESHQMPGKGESYDTYYADEPEMRYLWQQERRVLARMLREFYAERRVALLDFACGTGRITRFLEGRVASSVGVDVSEAMLAVARKKLVRSTLHRVNLVEECPFSPRSFNLITAFRFFLNAEPALRRAAVKALAPLLTEDGYFVFNVHQNQHSLYYGSMRLCCRLRQSEPDRTLSIGECASILGEVGWQICRVYSVGLFRLPKVRFSAPIRKWMDTMAMNCSLLGRFSDSPIIVARKAR